ncbi:MAG TPA: hypothetical protein VFR07_14960 [Mycobacteriales bacterium]|jgi:hypothetical protein|nr:hypothetical protein [Mycobacteriales bacterium]
MLKTYARTPILHGCLAAVIYAVITFLTDGGGSTIVVGSLVIGAITTAVSYLIQAAITVSRRR